MTRRSRSALLSIFFGAFPSVALSQNCLPPPPGMLGWWPGDGNPNDLVAGRNGTLQGGATYAAGKVGQAFSFNGASWVEVPDDPIWTLGTSDFTIDLWVNLNGLLGGRDPFIGHDDGGGGQNKWIFWYDAQGHDKLPGIPALRFHINSPVIFPHDTVAAPWSPILGRWYHIAVTRSGNTYTLYIDGSQVATDVSTFSIPDPSVPLTIGRAESSTLNGSEDEVEIYSRALTSQEIFQIYNAGSAGKCKSSVGPQGPVTSNVVANPSPAAVNVPILLTATVSDAATGGSNVASAAYSVNGGAFVPMNPADGGFNQTTENVAATVPPLFAAGVYTLCVRGTDADGNVGAAECIKVAVYSNSTFADFASGSGSINSPAGADLASPFLAGKADFAFVSKYAPGATTPSGSLEFRLGAPIPLCVEVITGQGFRFNSTTMEWLVATGGSRAIFRGTGTVTYQCGTASCKFEADAWDNSFQPGGIDAFGLKIYACTSGGDANGNLYAVSPTRVIQGNIIIH